MIEIGIESRDGKPLLYFKDNGVGIEAEHLQDIFDLFVKLDDKSEGSGLGLSLVRRILEAQGGRIWAESGGLGKGTTFLLLLDHLEVTTA